MKVMKFGGTSMADDITWKKVYDIIRKNPRSVVVVSATNKTTRKLIQCAQMAADGEIHGAQIMAQQIAGHHQHIIDQFIADYAHEKDDITREKCHDYIRSCMDDLRDYLSEIEQGQTLPPIHLDTVKSIGERLSSFLFAECGKMLNLPLTYVDALEIIKTDSHFGQARPDMQQIRENVQILTEMLDNEKIPIIGGFIGRDSQKNITTLGMEGSDYTASILGNVMDAEVVEIWTDVSGVFTFDPRIAIDARPIPELDYREAALLARFGAKILHPSTLEPVAEKDIPIRVKNMFHPERSGTKIASSNKKTSEIKAISLLTHIQACSLPTEKKVVIEDDELLVLDEWKNHQASDNHLLVSFHENTNWEELLSASNKNISISPVENKGLITLVGRGIRSKSLVIDHIKNELATIGNYKIYSTNEGDSLSVLLDMNYVRGAVQKLHELCAGVSHSKIVNE